jgi:hypothetical protein
MPYPPCGPPYCFDFVIWVQPGPLSYDYACQQAANEPHEYACDVQPDGDGFDVWCCLNGG